MAKQTTTKTTPAPATPVAETPAKAPKEKKTKAAKSTPTKEAEVKAEETAAVPADSSAPRVTLTAEAVLQNFDTIIASIETEIESLRDSQGKARGVKFLRSLSKNIKTLKSQTARSMRKKTRTVRNSNTNSGFLKPVKMSTAMAKFTGWDASVPRSRVDVTKYICDYIKQNNLQNPSDRRQILVDSKLGKLLSYDPAKADEPMTYYRIQSYLKPHFVKVEA